MYIYIYFVYDYVYNFVYIYIYIYTYMIPIDSESLKRGLSWHDTLAACGQVLNTWFTCKWTTTSRSR